MAIQTKHAFQSPKADGVDTSLVRPSNWNADHDITMDSGYLMGRASAGNGAVEQIPMFSGRNRIINGDMRIDQRNSGASLTPTGNVFCLDRWRANSTSSSKFSVQQITNDATAFTAAQYFMRLTSLSAYTAGSGENFGIHQVIEGTNISDLKWGTAAAKPVTISFKVKSSLTGTFGGSLQNYAGSRSYPFTYTIAQAGVETAVAVTIPGDTSGTWNTGVSGGIIANVGIGTGATLSGAAGAWSAGNYKSATGAVSVVATNGATFDITCVQLESGSIATPFENVDYSTMFQRCLRYYWKNSGGGAYATKGLGFGVTNNTVSIYTQFPVPMRAAPSNANSGVAVNDGINSYTIVSSTLESGTASTFGSSLTMTVSGTPITQFRPYRVIGDNNPNAFLEFNAEL